MKGRTLRAALAGAVVIAALATPAIGEARDAAAPGTVLAGFTSQGQPSFFKVTGDGRKMDVAGISLGMTCTSGAQFALSDEFAHVRISAAGRLHITFSQPPTAGSNGETYSATDSLTARLNRKHTQLSGVWRLQVNYSFTNGMSDQCDSGPVRFAATG